MRKENEKILENIAKYDKSKIVDFSLLNEKLQQVENKLDLFKSMEQKILKKDGAFENLLKRVDDLEANLCEQDKQIEEIKAKSKKKDEVINTLAEKLESLNEKVNSLEINVGETETEQTSCNPSARINYCDKCTYETEIESDLEKHKLETHPALFNCEFCDFVGKNEGGLKTHITRKHTKKMNQQNVIHCNFCNFNCNSEKDMETHMSEFRNTHSRRNYNDHMSPYQNRGQFSPRCPQRLPPRFPQSFPPFPMSPYDV